MYIFFYVRPSVARAHRPDIQTATARVLLPDVRAWELCEGAGAECSRTQPRQPDGTRPVWVGVAERDMGVFLICTA